MKLKMKLKKGVPLIDQHDQQGFWGGKFGGSFIPETLKKPVEDLTKEFKKLNFHQDKYLFSPNGCLLKRISLKLKVFLGRLPVSILTDKRRR